MGGRGTPESPLYQLFEDIYLLNQLMGVFGMWGCGLDAIFMVIIFINCTIEVSRGKQMCATLTPITTCNSVSTADRTHRDSQCRYLTWPMQPELAGNQTGDKKMCLLGNVESICDQDG